MKARRPVLTTLSPVSQISGQSLYEVDHLIEGLQGVRQRLDDDGDRLRRDIVQYAVFSQSIVELTKIVSDGVAVENSAGYNRTRNFGLYGHAESKKRKNLSSARHYDQIRFRFHTAKTPSRHKAELKSPRLRRASSRCAIVCPKPVALTPREGPDVRHETARVHHPSRRRGSVGVSGTRARAAKGDRFSGQRVLRCVPGRLAAFVQGLKDTGFIEGNNISIEWRWAEGQYNRLPSLAGELVSRGVAVIVAFDAPAASAAKAATKTIPIVFVTGADPVKTGLVDSFSRPGGNLTGVTVLISILGPKRLELLRELLPSTSTIALLVNPSNPNVGLMHPRQKRRPTLSGDAWRC